MIIYLDPEEEITGAVARIRASEGDWVMVVLPPGSRIATSRINFRLLEREAREKGLDLVCVSDEPGVRALAISAGVPAYDSVAHAEEGLAEFARQDERLAARTGEQRPRSRGEGTRLMSVPVPPDAARDSARLAVDAADEDELEPALAGLPRERRRRRRWRLGPLLAAVLAVLLVGVAAYGAYLFVPTATISLQPSVTSVGPVTTEVVADPQVAVVDPGEGVIPATTIAIPLSASGEFAATGSRVTTTRATGVVRFRSTNTVSEVVVPSGTRVSTPGGTDFQTTEQVTVPRAVFDTGTPGTAEAAIRAARPGARGNVGADQISVLPAGLAEQQLSVSNPRPTSGGGRVTQAVVSRSDYQAALDTLVEQLEAGLVLALADPALAPVGLTVYPSSAVIGQPTASQTADQLVGSVGEGFGLELSASASVLAVNESLVDEVALEQLRSLVPAGARLLEGSLDVSHAPGEVVRGRVVFGASADGSAYREPDRDALLAAVRGKTVAEARAIMETYGSADISVWPDFVDRVPDQPSRINLTIIPPTEGS